MTIGVAMTQRDRNHSGGSGEEDRGRLQADGLGAAELTECRFDLPRPGTSADAAGCR